MTEPDRETARALLWRHGLPEDIIDGALCLHAQELAGKIRARFDGSIIDDIREQDADLISPENWARTEPAAQSPADRAAEEADADTVANRAAQVITSMGADIRALTSQRDRYRTAWQSARQRAQAYGEGILRHVADRDFWKRQHKTEHDRHVAVVGALVTDRDVVRAETLREAADAIDRMDLPQDHVDMFDNGARWATAELRRLAGEQPAQDEAVEPELCGRTRSVAGTEYPPCARLAGHRAAYCRRANGKTHFLALYGPRAAAPPTT